MRLAFVTMVWRDYWLLEKWVSHNEKTVPRSQLYVINHGGDPEVDRIAAGCNLIHLPRDEVTPDLTRRRWDLKGGLVTGLLGFYDMVICTDVDELLVYVGAEGDLLSYLEGASRETEAISPVGLNMIPRPDDPGEGETVLARHPQALVHGKYTKPCIVNAPVGFTIGGHGLFRGDFRIDPNIVLFHLHYVTPDYAERMAARAEIVEQSKDYNAKQENPAEMPARYWINWSKPDRIRDKDFGNFDRATEMDVTNGFEEAAKVLRGAVQKKGRKKVVEPQIINENPRKVMIPEKWRGAF